MSALAIILVFMVFVLCIGATCLLSLLCFFAGIHEPPDTTLDPFTNPELFTADARVIEGKE